MKRDKSRIVLSPKERFWEIENFKYYDPDRTAGKYNFPTNEPTQHWPKAPAPPAARSRTPKSKDAP